ncbi:MAG: hypothetical protein MRERC_3c128 [Mycoplasmataceae bacterium RC_NB112A]|nr:MAG: hypothetical protein MRERC_3c128 [Mycoplasmataceae bacterium RC_NB112A]
MSTNKKTTKTINRRTRHILRQENNNKFLELEKPESDLPASFKPNRRAKKKGRIKYEERPITRELKVDQKVKNWREKKIKMTEQLHNCQKCGGWVAGDGCHCNCLKGFSNQEIVREINRRLKFRELDFEIEPLPKKRKVSSKK